MKTILLIISFTLYSSAHFLTLISNSDNINQANSKIILNSMFIHPFEQEGMNMEKPKGLFLNSKNYILNLEQTEILKHKAWRSEYKIKKPGVYKFFIEPKLYFEKDELKFISHIPKLIISAFGYEKGWDEAIGLKYEIIPMVKPFGLYAGNLFQAKVLHNSIPAKNINVEVELYNEFGLKAASNSHITQVVKTDDNGVFSFVMNHKGWWGFSALIEEGTKIHEGKVYPIENGALIWIKAY